MGTLRVGLVGAGFWGSRYIEKLATMPGVRVSAVVDVDATHAQACAARCGAEAAASLETLPGRIDAAVIATPARAHAEVAGVLLAARIPVLVEKPLAASAAESRALVELAARTGTLLVPAHIERFNPAVEAILKLCQRPRFIEANRLSPFPERSTDVDVVLDLMIHDIDLALTLSGEAPASVSARGVAVVTDQIDIANARLEFPGGCVADLTASRVSLKRERKVRVFAPNLYASLDTMAQEAQVVRRRPPADGRRWPEVYAEPLSVAAADPLAREIDAFLRAVRGQAPPAVPAEDGLSAVAVAERVLAEIARWEDGGAERAI